MIILQTTDFTGRYELAKAIATNPILQDIIDRFERITLYNLLGKELADLLIADLSNGVPQSTRFLTIYNAIYDDTDGAVYQSQGIKDILKAVVFYEYTKETLAKTSQSGVAVQVTENGTILSPLAAIRKGERLRNDAIESWETIQWYCEQNGTTYPEYNDSNVRRLTPVFSSLI